MSEKRVSSKELRERILKRANVKPELGTKKLLSPAEQPDIFPKTAKMKMLEYKYGIRMEQVLFRGSLRDVAKALHFEVDVSTISKWRKKVESVVGKVSYTD